MRLIVLNFSGLLKGYGYEAMDIYLQVFTPVALRRGITFHILPCIPDRDVEAFETLRYQDGAFVDRSLLSLSRPRRTRRNLLEWQVSN